ncbi:MAG: class I SAM-dependent methyltransferase, partial [Candidatus Aminicenantes bacterium]|nr:class I SAM-dependent methyltransferase [Candidatus Aminicenantes bacterium]
MKRQQKEIPWYKNWFDENYLLLYKHRNSDDAREQAALIQRILNPGKNCTILDLGCGEGRYTPFFKNRGCRIYGMDLSGTLLRNAKTKYPRLDLVLGDMRDIPFLPGKFDLILSLFTSFGYFERDEENRLVLDSVYRC